MLLSIDFSTFPITVKKKIKTSRRPFPNNSLKFNFDRIIFPQQEKKKCDFHFETFFLLATS